MDWIGLLKGTAVSIVLLGVAAHLLRSARQRAQREANRTTLHTPRVVVFRKKCVGGIHYANVADFRPGSDTCRYCEVLLSRPSESGVA